MVFPLCQNQHDDLKKQFYDLQEVHQVQGEDHNRLLDEHKDNYEKLQQVKESEVSHLKGTDRWSHAEMLLCFNTTRLHTNTYSSTNVV